MTVHLVGAGPGDPDLLTLRAARLLSTADAVVYDRLIGDGVLDLVSPSAERYPVGKRPGRAGPSQRSINELLVQLGQRLPTVVRIKGGDPYLFGRGVEERRTIEEAAIAVEVVPAISSALAAPLSGGISVTERTASSGVCIVTAQQSPASQPIDWSALARSGLTIVVLMGARHAAAIGSLLMEGGLPGHTPAAAITDATRPTEAVWRGPLTLLGSSPIAAPSVLVIGQVAADDRAAPALAAPALVGSAAGGAIGMGDAGRTNREPERPRPTRGMPRDWR